MYLSKSKIYNCLLGSPSATSLYDLLVELNTMPDEWVSDDYAENQLIGDIPMQRGKSELKAEYSDLKDKLNNNKDMTTDERRAVREEMLELREEINNV